MKHSILVAAAALIVCGAAPRPRRSRDCAVRLRCAGARRLPLSHSLWTAALARRDLAGGRENENPRT